MNPRVRAYLRGSLRLFFVAALLTSSACGIFHRGSTTQNDTVLMQQGVEAFNRGRYKKAIKLFQMVKDRFPFSPYVTLAEQKIADAHYLRKEYPEAVYAYQDFEKLHPRNPIIPYIIYQIGMCYYAQMADIDRDQEYTRKAAAEFHRLIKTYPRSAYAIRAENKLNECLSRLARAELYVGRIYYRLKRYKAARARFLGVVRKFPDQGEYREALKYLAKCDEHLRELRAREKEEEGGS